jgi:hypothetical protein
MQEPTFLILTAPAAAPLHGYSIMTEVRSISAGGSDCVVERWTRPRTGCCPPNCVPPH